MLHEPSVAYWGLQEFQKICLILATTDSNNYENITHRIIKHSTVDWNRSFGLMLHTLGFNSIDKSRDLLICNHLQDRQVYLSGICTIQCYLDWFEMVFEKSLFDDFSLFLDHLDMKTNDSVSDPDFNMTQSMVDYVNDNKFPKANSELKWSLISKYYSIYVSVLYIGM